MEGYEERTCRTCGGAGTRYDATCADKVSPSVSAVAECWTCRGRGFTRHITDEGFRAEIERRAAARTA